MRAGRLLLVALAAVALAAALAGCMRKSAPRPVAAAPAPVAAQAMPAPVPPPVVPGPPAAAMAQAPAARGGIRDDADRMAARGLAAGKVEHVAKQAAHRSPQHVENFQSAARCRVSAPVPKFVIHHSTR